MVTESFGEAIGQVNALPYRPDFVMHTGDLTHLSMPGQFDQVKQMLDGLHTGHVFAVPGEHDGIGDDGKMYRQFFGAGTKGDGWYSFDLQGVHFIALVNTLGLETLGHLGNDQLDWLRNDVAGLSGDTPIVVFSHIPLFAMYPKWGWSTDDSVQALSYLRRFASVTCLNGHVHQLFTKTEGNVTFFSATTTAYPLPRPGDGPAPSPVTLPAGQLHAALGIREVGYVGGGQRLAVKDRRLA
jgi:3',5'-cyclic AMP phosphodiesterase CpdA